MNRILVATRMEEVCSKCLLVSEHKGIDNTLQIVNEYGLLEVGDLHMRTPQYKGGSSSNPSSIGTSRGGVGGKHLCQ